MSELTLQHSVSISSIEGEVYDGHCSIETKNFDDLSQDELLELTSKCLEKLNSKSKNNIFKSYNLYTKDEVKELEGYSVSNKDTIYVSSVYRSGIHSVDLNKKIDEKNLDIINVDPQVRFFIEISVPEEVIKQMDEYVEKKKIEKEKKNQEKTQRKIEKYQKLLSTLNEKSLDKPDNMC